MAKSAFRNIGAWLGLAPQVESATPERREAAIVQAFSGNLSVARRGLTYVINITFWSEDGAKAARIANAVAETYLQRQKDAKIQAVRRANGLIQTHVREPATAGVPRRAGGGGL